MICTTDTGSILVGSVEYLRVAVSETVDGVALDPTTHSVAIAIRLRGAATSLSWQTAVWETDESGSTPVYRARVLVGSGAFVLAAGSYSVYVKVTDSPETPQLLAGRLDVVAA